MTWTRSHEYAAAPALLPRRTRAASAPHLRCIPPAPPPHLRCAPPLCPGMLTAPEASRGWPPPRSRWLCTASSGTRYAADRPRLHNHLRLPSPSPQHLLHLLRHHQLHHHLLRHHQLHHHLLHHHVLHHHPHHHSPSTRGRADPTPRRRGCWLTRPSALSEDRAPTGLPGPSEGSARSYPARSAACAARKLAAASAARLRPPRSFEDAPLLHPAARRTGRAARGASTRHARKTRRRRRRGRLLGRRVLLGPAPAAHRGVPLAVRPRPISLRPPSTATTRTPCTTLSGESRNTCSV